MLHIIMNIHMWHAAKSFLLYDIVVCNHVLQNTKYIVNSAYHCIDPNKKKLDFKEIFFGMIFQKDWSHI